MQEKRELTLWQMDCSDDRLGSNYIIYIMSMFTNISPNEKLPKEIAILLGDSTKMIVLSILDALQTHPEGITISTVERKKVHITQEKISSLLGHLLNLRRPEPKLVVPSLGDDISLPPRPGTVRSKIDILAGKVDQQLLRNIAEQIDAYECVVVVLNQNRIALFPEDLFDVIEKQLFQE